MSQIMKAFTGVFFILLMMCSGIGISTMYLQSMQAQNFQAAIVDELENSDYAIPVITESFQIAKDAGYKLKLTLFLQDGSMQVYESQEAVSGDISAVDMGKVELYYPVKVGFLGVEEQALFWSYSQ